MSWHNIVHSSAAAFKFCFSALIAFYITLSVTLAWLSSLLSWIISDLPQKSIEEIQLRFQSLNVASTFFFFFLPLTSLCSATFKYTSPVTFQSVSCFMSVQWLPLFGEVSSLRAWRTQSRKCINIQSKQSNQKKSVKLSRLLTMWLNELVWELLFLL